MTKDLHPTSRRTVLGFATGAAAALGSAGSAIAKGSGSKSEARRAPSTTLSPELKDPSGRVSVVTDFGARGDGQTDDTAAIQAALDSGASEVVIPSGRKTRLYKFTNLTLPLRVRVTGGGARSAVLHQIESATGAALTFVPTLADYGVPFDISEGGSSLQDIGIDVASEVGIRIVGGATASLFSTNRLRIVHRSSQSFNSAPYTVSPGTIGIQVDGGSPAGRHTQNSAPVYLSEHTLGEIRGFETAIKASGTVNEWTFRSFWLLDNRIGFDLADVSTWSITATVESGVNGARAFALSGAVSNLMIEGGRWELTQSEAYGMEFAPSLSASNVAVRNTNVIIAGDGSALPGRKWIGSPPASMTMEGAFFDSADGNERYFCIAPSQSAVRLPSTLRVGGHKLGDGQIVFGRDHDNGALSSLRHDGNTLTVDAPNGFRVAQPNPGEAWSQPFILGAYSLWVDQEGRLRISAGYPGNDHDGTIVGNQT